MVILGDAVHNFIDGLSLGAGLSDSHLTGFSIGIAVLFEEIPHELGDFSILLSSGMSYKKAAAVNFMSASTCYLGMSIGLYFGQSSRDSRYIFAVAAGMFLYISLFNLMTDLNENLETSRSLGMRYSIELILFQNLGILTGVSILYTLARVDESLIFQSLTLTS